MPIKGKTLNKQIVSAKNETRAYHGEMLREHQWLRLFSLSEVEKTKTNELSAINLYSILERRIDTIIHRALFASSIKQARQMVIHGKVNVNGKRVRDPGYLLEPGDMFSADVITVMRNTGSPEMFKNKSLKGEKSLKNIGPYIPRPYMSPFSFVPVYLEVYQKYQVLFLQIFIHWHIVII
ncbi:hypothetical protein MERGE_002889 [Pneumocystis wakefieldiae]|uniref:RNA-binding S4 domain-containing protein n=1 Tax=Pneumocystis wakefieldiae TaxID=38082 RepID=A0A899FYJ9_9ASCO|nr:hypothetical protein MERGE_002889 [Pneumocystis wakefieldiae]